MPTIDIGDAAIERANASSPNYTFINLGNPANASGIIDTIEVWAANNITGFRVGTFYLVSGTTYRCRDSVTIGSVTAGSKQTFTGLSLAVQAGDFIGCYFTAGYLERDTTGGSGYRWKSGEYIDPGDEISYSLSSTYVLSLYGTGVTTGITISPSGLSQPIAYGTPKLSLSIKPPSYQQVVAYGTPKLNLSIKPAGYQQAIAYGTPTVSAGIVISPPGLAVVIAYGTPEVQVGEPPLFIYPPGLQVVIAYGTPSLRYPQTISPPGLSVPLAYGTPSVGIAVIKISPQGIAVIISYGTPTVLKYVWHVILDGRYHIESPETNRTFVIGRDVYGNPVWGEAQDSTELGLVGERLDFQPDPAIPTQAQAADVAAAMLSKIRLGKKRGAILIPYNCGQELWDVVQITDAGANQQAVSFRVVGIRLEYYPKQARYEHMLLLGSP